MVKIIWETDDSNERKMEFIGSILNEYFDILILDCKWKKSSKKAILHLFSGSSQKDKLELIDGLETCSINIEDIDQEFLDDLKAWAKGDESRPSVTNRWWGGEPMHFAEVGTSDKYPPAPASIPTDTKKRMDALNTVLDGMLTV